MRIHGTDLIDVFPFVRRWESLPAREREFVATRLSYPERYDGVIEAGAIELLLEKGFLVRPGNKRKRARMAFPVSGFRRFIRGNVWSGSIRRSTPAAQCVRPRR